MKRTLSFIIVLTLMFTLAACGTPAAQPESGAEMTNPPVAEPTPGIEPVVDKSSEMPADEYQRAAWYGLLPEELATADPDGTVVTWAQYCDVLGRVIKLHGEAAYPAWEEMTANAPDTEMKRDGAMVSLLFAAKTIDYATFNAQPPSAFQEYAGKVWEVVTMDYPVFDWDTPVDLGDGCSDSNHVGPAYDFCVRRVSVQSGKSLLEFDENNDLRLEQPLPLREAALSAIRLYESEERPASLDDVDFTEADAWEAEFLALAGERRQAILDNNEEMPCVGTAYYVSNSGDDANDGRTPETAWATIDRVNRDNLGNGDAVYFERGGLWRGAFEYREGITYSAYGTGEKPKIYGSPENGAGGEKWSLYAEDGGAKIWAYNNTIPECGGVVLGDTNTIAKRVFSWYDGSAHYFTEDVAVPFDMVKALRVDLSFYCDMKIPESELPFDPRPYSGECTLYMRCDDGNPGEIYNSIEFMCKDKSLPAGMIQVANGVIDNLCIMYFAATAIELNDGSTVQNCEIAYGADGIHEFFTPETEGGACLWTDGNAIHFVASDITVQDNYIHDIEGHGVNFETGGNYEATLAQIPYSGVTICGNVIEHVGAPMYIANNQDGLEDAVAFDGFTIEDNYYLYAGYGWHEGYLSNINPSTELKLNFLSLNFGGRPNVGEHTIRVANNVFYRAVNSLVCTVGQTEDIPTFENNIFSQAFGHVVIWTAEAEVYAALPEATREKVAAQYGDAGTVYVLRPNE